MLLPFMGLSGTLNSKKSICCLPRSNKQDLSVCLVQVLSLLGYHEDVCVASRKNICQDSLTSVETWRYGFNIEVMGFVQEKAFTASSLMQKRSEEWRPTQNIQAVSYLWILKTNLSHTTVIPVEIWVCLLSFLPLLCISICFSKVIPCSLQPGRPKCLVFTFFTSSQIVLTESLTLIFFIF